MSLCKRSCLECAAQGKAELLRGVEREALVVLDDAKVSRFYQRGDTLYAQGENLPGLYCIGGAAVKQLALHACGKSHLVGLAGPGDLVGLPFVLSSTLASHTAVVFRSGVICCYPMVSICMALVRDPEVTLNLLKSLANLQQATESRLICLQGLTAVGRVAHWILDLAGPSGKSLAVSRTELAQLASTTLETVSRVVQDLARKGAISVSGRRIAVLEFDTLQALCCPTLSENKLDGLG